MLWNNSTGRDKKTKQSLTNTRIIMKQLTTLKLLVFTTLSITAFPAFTMENESKIGQNKYMSYCKLLELSKKPGVDSKKYTYEVICYNVNVANRWVCPNPLDKDLTKTIIESTKLFAKKAAEAITKKLIRDDQKKEDKEDEEMIENLYNTQPMKKFTEKLYNVLLNKHFRTVFHITKEEIKNPNNWTS